jgi:hypothetical protein
VPSNPRTVDAEWETWVAEGGRHRLATAYQALNPDWKPPNKPYDIQPEGSRLNEIESEGIPVVLEGLGGPHFRHMRIRLPLTPEAIPIQASAAWNDVQIIGIGERANFAGRNLDVISFSGVLEPGIVLDDGAVHMQNQATTGQTMYWHPGYFRDKLRSAMKDGEVMRLTVGMADVDGEQTPWDGEVSIRDFTWRFEDPDPSVLYYDITFKQHLTRQLYGVREKLPRHTKIITRDNDTLGALATREWKDRHKWANIRNINKKRIGALWLERSGHDKLHKKRAAGRVNITASNIENALGPNTRFEAGIELYMEKR